MRGCIVVLACLIALTAAPEARAEVRCASLGPSVGASARLELRGRVLRYCVGRGKVRTLRSVRAVGDTDRDLALVTVGRNLSVLELDTGLLAPLAPRGDVRKAVVTSAAGGLANVRGGAVVLAVPGRGRLTLSAPGAAIGALTGSGTTGGWTEDGRPVSVALPLRGARCDRLPADAAHQGLRAAERGGRWLVCMEGGEVFVLPGGGAIDAAAGPWIVASGSESDQYGVSDETWRLDLRTGRETGLVSSRDFAGDVAQELILLESGHVALIAADPTPPFPARPPSTEVRVVTPDGEEVLLARAESGAPPLHGLAVDGGVVGWLRGDTPESAPLPAG